MKLIMFVVLVAAIVAVGYYQQKHPTPQAKDSHKPAQILNVPEGVVVNKTTEDTASISGNIRDMEMPETPEASAETVDGSGVEVAPAEPAEPEAPFLGPITDLPPSTN